MPKGGAISVAPDLAEQVATLYARVGARAFHLAHILTGERAAAEEVVQEAFLRLVHRVDQLEQHDELDAYLMRVVRNLALNAQRKAKAGAKAIEAKGAPALFDGASAPDPDEVATVSRALLELPVEQREVVHLRVWEGLSFPEIAARTGAPLGTLHSRYRYAVERLRALLGRSA